MLEAIARAWQTAAEMHADCAYGGTEGMPCTGHNLLAALTPAELRELDARMHAAQAVGSAVWPATWLSGPLNQDITDVRREINAVYPFGEA